MSIYTEGTRQDPMVERHIFVSAGDKDSAGKTRYRVLPWQFVLDGTGRGMFEPENTNLSLVSGNVQRHPTHIEFTEEREFVHRDGSTPLIGGQVGLL